ncbi:MAG: periplasmic heavy metal sensor [Desulfovibrionaceae bacterium]|jgi:zinc resistance-associated protein|nr:periplasmic heavy metal sensor [Desulfovibrionaceae bacterium]
MSNKTIIITLAIVGVFALAAVAWANGGYGYGPMGYGHMGYGYHHRYFNDNANLTPEQQQALNDLTAKHQAAMRPLVAQLQAKQAKLDYLATDPAANEREINSVTNDIADLNAKLLKERTGFRTALAKLGIETGPGYGMGYGMGYGRGYGHGYMMGSGYGPGACPGWGGRW